MFRIRFVFMLLVSLSVLFEIPVFADSDIQISAFTDIPDPALRGGEINYSITVVNGGIDSATNSSLTFPLPVNTEFVSATTPECTHNSETPGIVTCLFGAINGTTNPGSPTDPRTVDITLRTTPSTGNLISVTATVSADNDNTSANNTETQNTTINNGADVQIEKSDSPDPVYGSGTLTYTLTVKNNGPNDAAIVTVMDALPPDVTYQSYSGLHWHCSHSSGIVTCSRNNLLNGQTAFNITITTRVTGANSGDVSNTAVVSAQSAPNINMDPVLSNNIDSEITQILPGTDLSITKVTVGSIIAGDNVTFELRPRNNGPITAVNASISDTLPADFIFVSATGTGWSCSHDGSPTDGTITCTRGSFPVGNTNNITVIVTAPISGGGTSNTATINSDTTDPNLGNNSSTVNLVVVPDGADLSLTKSKSPNPVALGSNITSNFTVHNNGPRATSGTVTVVDNLSSSESYVSFSGTNWSCLQSSGIVTCTYSGSIASGANASTLTITTTATAAGVITNNASVSDESGEDDIISSK